MFAKGFRRIPSCIPPKSVPAPRSQSTSQFLSRTLVCNQPIRGPVALETASTFEGVGTVEGREFCEMLCGASARLPQGSDKELKCELVHQDTREPNSRLVGRDRGTAYPPVRKTFPRRLLTTGEWSSKHPDVARFSERPRGATQHSWAFGRYCPLGQSGAFQPLVPLQMT
jgi:hypothetical protein